MLRGQAWVALHGDFTIEQLKTLIERLEENCLGLERKPNDNTKRPGNQLGSISENN